MLLKVVKRPLPFKTRNLLLPFNLNNLEKRAMSDYEKILRKRLKRDALIGVGVISVIMVVYFTAITLL